MILKISLFLTKCQPLVKQNYNDDPEISLHRLCWHANLDANVTELEFKMFGMEFKCFAENMRESTSTNENVVRNEDEIDSDADDDVEVYDNNNESDTNKFKRRRLEWALLTEFFSIEYNQSKFKNVHALYQFVLILPSEQVGCERSFSIMKNIKTHNRSTISDINLETYMIMNTALDLVPLDSFSEIVNDVAQMAPHLRNKLLN